MAKNHLIAKSAIRTTPELELTSILLAAETAREIKADLTGEKSLSAVDIDRVIVYNDSMVALHWLNQFIHLQKQNKKAPYVRNRLERLDHVAEECPLVVKHVAGKSNPADYVTREVSPDLLSKTNYWRGPKDRKGPDEQMDEEYSLALQLPRASVYSQEQIETLTLITQDEAENGGTTTEESLLPLSKYSEYQKLWRVTSMVMGFI